MHDRRATVVLIPGDTPNGLDGRAGARIVSAAQEVGGDMLFQPGWSLRMLQHLVGCRCPGYLPVSYRNMACAAVNVALHDKCGHALQCCPANYRLSVTDSPGLGTQRAKFPLSLPRTAGLMMACWKMLCLALQAQMLRPIMPHPPSLLFIVHVLAMHYNASGVLAQCRIHLRPNMHVVCALRYHHGYLLLCTLKLGDGQL